MDKFYLFWYVLLLLDNFVYLIGLCIGTYLYFNIGHLHEFDKMFAFYFLV